MLGFVETLRPGETCMGTPLERTKGRTAVRARARKGAGESIFAQRAWACDGIACSVEEKEMRSELCPVEKRSEAYMVGGIRH